MTLWKMRRDAVISSDGVYRYSLTREWGDPALAPRWICFCGLNPSTADAEVDDPTIRREVGFAKSFGATAFIKVNLYAYRATNPDHLVRHVDTFGFCSAVGDRNVTAVRSAVRLARSGLCLGVFAAWGTLPRRLPQSKLILDALGSPLMCLGVTKQGAPRHPLYLPKTAMPMEWMR